MRRVALYPGSFDPPTLGHLDVIQRASPLFQTLIVGVGHNRSKHGFLTLDERLESLRAATADLENVRIEAFEGLMVEFAKREGVDVVVRGLRVISDFEYEFRMASANRHLAPELETVYLMTRDEYSFLASSVVKEIALLGGEYGSFVPPSVAEVVARRLARGS